MNYTPIMCAKWKEEDKQIIDENKRMCPILHETIKENAHYMECSECHNNFDYDAIQNYFKDKRNKQCPMCRTEWTSNIKYKNVLSTEVQTT